MLTLVFGDRSCQLVEPDFAACARQQPEGMNVAAREGFKGLAVGEVQIHPAAVSLDQTEGVKLAHGAVVHERAEVAPVHVEPFAGGGWFMYRPKEEIKL
jgi:hypothetical protein